MTPQLGCRCRCLEASSLKHCLWPQRVAVVTWKSGNARDCSKGSRAWAPRALLLHTAEAGVEPEAEPAGTWTWTWTRGAQNPEGLRHAPLKGNMGMAARATYLPTLLLGVFTCTVSSGRVNHAEWVTRTAQVTQRRPVAREHFGLNGTGGVLVLVVGQ